jgi:predicted transcriptional regulator of viral defense system
MDRLTYREIITNIVMGMPYGQAFRTDIIAETMAEEYAIPLQKAKPIINVTLKRLADKGVIERFQKGVYYRVKQTAFGKTRPSDEFLEAQLLTRRGNEIIGYETGHSLMNRIGLTTLVPKKREIATNAYRKNINSRFIIARKPAITVNSNNFRYLQFLDVVRDLPEAHVDTENPRRLLHAFAEKNELDTVKTLAYARQHYPQKTLLNLVDILVER